MSLAAVLLACRPAPAVERPVQLVAVQRDGKAAVALFSAVGVRINALAVPALELRGQPVRRLDQGARTADSAYFAEPPWTPREGLVAGSGTLRVSYCRADEAFCRGEVLSIALE